MSEISRRNSATDRRDAPRAPVAVIDLGSNTVLLLVMSADSGALFEASEITRLGKGVFESGVLDPGHAERTRRVVKAFADRARGLGAQEIVVVGTEAVRRARDGPGFLASLVELAGVTATHVLTGEQEAHFTLEASRRASTPGERPLLVVDVGGGSTELAWLEEGRVRGVSLPLGTVRLTEATVHADPPSPGELESVGAAADIELGKCPGLLATGEALEVVAVAGTATTLAALDQALVPYDPDRVEGYRVRRERLQHWLERLARLPLAERRALPGLEPARVDVILAGLVILDRVLERLAASEFGVSGRGVRHGVALSLLEADGAL